MCHLEGKREGSIFEPVQCFRLGGYQCHLTCREIETLRGHMASERKKNYWTQMRCFASCFICSVSTYWMHGCRAPGIGLAGLLLHRVTLRHIPNRSWKKVWGTVWFTGWQSMIVALAEARNKCNFYYNPLTWEHGYLWALHCDGLQNDAPSRMYLVSTSNFRSFLL